MDKQLLSQKEQKEIMLDMLVYLDHYFSQNGYTYFLDAGTLLGAVRHHGFIPWDDDIDINMPRGDYDRFILETKRNGGFIGEIYKLEYPGESLHVSLKLGDNRTELIEYPDKKPTKSMVYIDIFPKDGLPDKNLRTQIICWVSEKLALMNWFCKISIYSWQKEHNIMKRIAGKLGRVMIKNPNRAVNLQNRFIHWVSKRYPMEKCNYVTTLVNGEFHKIAPKSCFASAIDLEFEGYRFKGPVGYDEYLHCLYPGDYMQLPPEEKRVKHNTIVYWK